LKVSGLEASSARRAWRESRGSGWTRARWRSEGNVSGIAAVFKKGVAFTKSPRESSAVGDGLLETVRVCDCGVGFGGRAVRVEYQEDAVVILACEFANHKRAGASGSLPVDMAGAVCRQVIAESVEILAAAFCDAFDDALDAGEKLKEFGGRFDGWIDEGLAEQIETARLLQKAEREAGNDAKGFLAIGAPFREEKRDGLLHGLTAGDVGKINGRREERGGLVFRGDALDPQRKGWQG